MRASRFLIATQKETPADAEIVSHRLMLRAGMIRKLASGLYTWLPLGLRVLRKVEQVVREEMDNAGAQEVSMPMVQPADLWQESGRWDEYGEELLRILDRHERDFCLGPTHEEVITDLTRSEIRSYKQLPVNFYQIQTKFRDERRPRFGVMRAREFLMKDAYSFHLDRVSLQETYEVMHRTYCGIFDRLGLDYRPVLADTGSIGGTLSHEFHVLADSGEDAIAFSSASNYAANLEMAEAVASRERAPAPGLGLAEVHTPGMRTIMDVAAHLALAPDKMVKTLIVRGEEEDSLIALLLRGDHELNDVKAEKLAGVRAPLEFADEATVKQAIGCGVGSLGPRGLPEDIPLIADRSVAVLADFACGANRDDYHLTGVNWERDCPLPRVEDIRNVVAGDPSPDGQGELGIRRGIEVGHIFQLGTKYSEAMNCQVMGENGKPATLIMGCYGIGVSRVVAAAIEQNYDERGILWPDALAPFQIALVPMKYETEAVREATDKLYAELTAAGYEVLLDDRDKKTSPGVKFADMELIGIPHRIVVSDRGLADGMLEYKHRRDAQPQPVPASEILSFINSRAHR